MRVLVIDDEPMLAEQIRAILAGGDDDVAVCSRGADALQMLEQSTFDVVITDLAMPDVSGWEIALEAKRHNPNVRVGLVTGWGAEFGDEASYRSRGVDFVVAKPYRIQTLRDAVHKRDA